VEGAHKNYHTSTVALPIVWWWQFYGQLDCLGAPELLLLADGGGSNGYRPRLWKYALQYSLVNSTGLAVTVCHYPTGASKWNWVEHRLFSPISLNWAGQPVRTPPPTKTTFFYNWSIRPFKMSV